MSVEVGSGALLNRRHSCEAVGPALDLIVAELDPVAVSLLVVDRGGAVRCEDARASGLVGDARREVDNWHRRLGPRAPLATAALTDLDRPVITFADVGGARGVLLDNPALLAAYRRIGAIDDTRMLIRDEERLAAMIAVWRPLQSRPWSEEERRRLETLRPLIEMAWLPPHRPHPMPGAERLPGADLTPRQREVAELLLCGATDPEVARALGISRNTVKTHARAVLTKLGAGSRQDLVLALQSPSTAP